MPARLTPVVFVFLASAAVATAEPLPPAAWYVRVNAQDGYDGILLGSELKPPETDGGAGVTYSHYWDTGISNYGMVRIGLTTIPEPPQLFSFGPGFAQTVETLPADMRLSPGIFQLSWGVNSVTDGSGSGTLTGTLSADGLFTSGSGNYLIGLDHTESFSIDGHPVELRFTGVNREGGADIEMRITAVESTTSPDVPEPGTLILGGIALAGGFGAWVRKRRKDGV